MSPSGAVSGYFSETRGKKNDKIESGTKKCYMGKKQAGIMAFLYAIALGSGSSQTKVTEGKLRQFLLIETSYLKF